MRRSSCSTDGVNVAWCSDGSQAGEAEEARERFAGGSVPDHCDVTYADVKAHERLLQSADRQARER